MTEKFSIDNWSTQLRKGLLELCIVNVLAQGECYAYDLVKQLANLRGLVISEGTLYPLLSRMRKAGLLDTRLEESPAGPARKYYSLTPEGRRVRTAMNEFWNEMSQGIAALQHGEEMNHDQLDP